ncbi:hypothetical protein ARMGADRAFT_299604 [Armillaria gallica]|uniref:Uncharacterized protein n=1 Tax=Armillaria gallica TaxID=47427 RepID=A0A2H3D5L2_ARMGA|nr:hypothetical protein ARMGADRAFT_299604 [Armillaria gallica]
MGSTREARPRVECAKAAGEITPLHVDQLVRKYGEAMKAFRDVIQEGLAVGVADMEVYGSAFRKKHGCLVDPWPAELAHSTMNSSADFSDIHRDWEVPVSEIRSWTYILIEVFGFEAVLAFRDRAIESLLDEMNELLLACEGEVLRNHAAINDRVTAWRNNVAVVPSHAPPIRPFDLHRRVFSFLNDEHSTPGEAPDDAPTSIL